ncbi:hypothetical protein XENOCAPTIV_006197 [Xenoophorus captivus]|uniref:Uncharacterized protein n=1 Tax=Xenoophorus captivus TaxID=1517983 RepID=A0ABV0R774_9TELE
MYGFSGFLIEIGTIHPKPCTGKAALAATSKLYDSVDDALHQLVRVSNRRGRDLEALGRLAGLVDKLEKELHSETLSVLSDLEGWCELNWAGLSNIQIRLPLVREKLRDMSHCDPVVRCSLFYPLLTHYLFFHLPSCVPPSNPTFSFPGCTVLSPRTWRRGTPRSMDPDKAPLPAKPPRKRHPSFDLQALLAPRKGAATPKPESPVGGASRNSPMSWLGRKNLADPVIATSMAAAMPGWERQYVAVLKGVEETYLPLLELSDTPASIRGKGESLFPNWGSLSAFHSQNLLPAMEGALVQSLLQQDCFSKYVSSKTC